ncbi:hypothetical protein CVT24_008392 [Panaeolus cyanescens]|uniref:Uncharacterized protein n=1 Tax=Panaeolus cyanescens TaxID=181874 RepID=A0A409VL69_9AGAR|nr:hypothetical protein CVT24_008392 [Panaeolus cyanescens]
MISRTVAEFAIPCHLLMKHEIVVGLTIAKAFWDDSMLDARERVDDVSYHARDIALDKPLYSRSDILESLSTRELVEMLSARLDGVSMYRRDDSILPQGKSIKRKGTQKPATAKSDTKGSRSPPPPMPPLPAKDPYVSFKEDIAAEDKRMAEGKKLKIGLPEKAVKDAQAQVDPPAKKQSPPPAAQKAKKKQA